MILSKTIRRLYNLLLKEQYETVFAISNYSLIVCDIGDRFFFPALQTRLGPYGLYPDIAMNGINALQSLQTAIIGLSIRIITAVKV